jgi:hypothetical protein
MKHKIGKFTLELSHDGETIYGDIECGEFTASLCHAEDTGSLYNDDDTKRLPVPRSVLDKCWKFEQEFFERLTKSTL